MIYASIPTPDRNISENPKLKSVGIEKSESFADLNKRFGIERITSLDKPAIIVSKPKTMMASMFGAEKTEFETKVLVQTKTENVLLLESSKDDSEAIAKAFANHPDIEYAEPDMIGELFTDVTGIAVQKTQQTKSQKPVSSENATIGVAVIDSGIDLDHQALQGKILKNIGENPLPNGIDDDGNGYVDDINGWNFVENTGNVNDFEGHGTHISGIIAGDDGNTPPVGVNPYNARILPLKISNGSRGIRLSTVVSALLYAGEQNISTVNMSLGFSSDSNILESSIKKLIQKDVAIVAAAGNNGNSIMQYPAAYDEVIAIGAETTRGERLKSSNFGEWVDLSLPGRVYSSLPNDQYGAKSGSSQAAAVATGLLSLALTESETNGSALSMLSRKIESRSKKKDDWIVSSAQKLKQSPRQFIIEKSNDLEQKITPPEIEALLLAYNDPNDGRLFTNTQHSENQPLIIKAGDWVGTGLIVSTQKPLQPIQVAIAFARAQNKLLPNQRVSVPRSILRSETPISRYEFLQVMHEWVQNQ